MPIAPAIPVGGLVGLRFLERTLTQQTETFNKSPDIEREVAYFLEQADTITTAEDLVTDRRALGVVLGAFGLDDDINKQAFIRKVLEEGTTDTGSFANRLTQPEYKEMSAFLGFGDLGGLLIFEGTQTELVDRYRERQFERAVGEQDVDLRLALNFKREAVNIANDSDSERLVVLNMLGSQPVRAVLEGALFLPETFALLDVDQQVEVVQERLQSFLGGSDPATLRDPANIAQLNERFLLRQQTLNGSANVTSPAATALSVLQSSGLGAVGQQNLFASNFV